MEKFFLSEKQKKEIEDWVIVRSNKKIEALSYLKTEGMFGLEFTYNSKNIFTLVPLSQKKQLLTSIVDNIKNGNYDKYLNSHKGAKNAKNK